MRASVRSCLRDARRDRGDADPVLVLVSLAVLALVTLGITVAVINAQQWGTTHAFNSVEQTTEDASRLAWMADVGTATQVVPAAKQGTTAQTSVRFDNVNREEGWPAGAQCRAVTWWLEDTVTDPKSPDALDPTTGERVPSVAAHRQITYYAGEAADGTCVTTSATIGRGAQSTPVKNAAPGAKFSYVNGHLRDLVYPTTATPGLESCAAVAKGDTARLTTCVGRSATPYAGQDSQRTLWEWADPNPVQVLLEMQTAQVGTGAGYGTQIGWREMTGRRELVGNPSSPVTDTLGNPPAPAPAGTPPLAAQVIVSSPDDGTADSVTVTRTDTRDVDGYEYRCSETLNGTATGAWLPGAGNANAPTGGPLPTTTATTIPGTKPGHAYTCAQRGWVKAVTGPLKDQRFAEGVSAWSAPSTLATRRPASTTVSGVLNANNTMTFSWPARDGATGYEAQHRTNSGAWVAAGTLPAGQLSWTTAPQPADTRVHFRVRPVNAGGAPAWAETNVARVFPAPSVGIEGGATGKDSYGTWWDHVPDFIAGTHSYEVYFKADGGAAWSGTTVTGNGYTLSGIVAGRTGSVMVRAVGVNTGVSPWSNTVSVTRPVAAPAAPGVNMGTITGAVTTSANAVWCEPGTSAEYAVWANVYGWRGWGTNTAEFYAAEGTTVNVAWKARCVAPTGVISPESGEAGGSGQVPYTPVSSANISNSGNGNTGTDVTFSWSAPGGGYFRVTSDSGAVRYAGTGNSVRVARETGITCGTVHAYRTYNHYLAGVRAATDRSCATTYKPAPPTPSGVFIGGYTPTLGYIKFATDTDASSFTYQIRWYDNDSGAYVTFGAVTVPASSPLVHISGGTVTIQIPDLPSTGKNVSWTSLEGRAYATNDVGSSGWSGWN